MWKIRNEQLQTSHVIMKLTILKRISFVQHMVAGGQDNSSLCLKGGQDNGSLCLDGKPICSVAPTPATLYICMVGSYLVRRRSGRWTDQGKGYIAGIGCHVSILTIDCIVSLTVWSVIRRVYIVLYVPSHNPFCPS
jgi:hypothetical protein